MKERTWRIACFIMGAVGFGCILALNQGIALCDSLICWWFETKRIVKDQWNL